jgi:hypothetical protein
MAPDTDTQVQDRDQTSGQNDPQDDDSALLDSAEDALREAGYEDQADKVGNLVSIEDVKGGILRDLRDADPIVADLVVNRKTDIAQTREDEEAAAEQRRIEAEAEALRVAEEERQRKIKAGELTYADEHPVEYHDLGGKAKDRTAFMNQMNAFGKHSQAWQAERWDQATPEERGTIAAGYGEPLHADLAEFTPKDGELTQLERESLKAQVKKLKATKYFLDTETVDAIIEAERQVENANTRAGSDAGLQKLVHLAKGIELGERSQLPFQTPHKVQQTVVVDGKKTVEWVEKPDTTTTRRTLDGGSIVTEIDKGTGQLRTTEFSPEEAAELKTQLLLEAPQELPQGISGSVLTDEFSRPVHDFGTEPGEAARVQVNPLAKTEGPATPEAFLEAHGKITKADLKLWPADVQARFNRSYPDAARALLRGEEVAELS